MCCALPESAFYLQLLTPILSLSSPPLLESSAPDLIIFFGKLSFSPPRSLASSFFSNLLLRVMPFSAFCISILTTFFVRFIDRQHLPSIQGFFSFVNLNNDKNEHPNISILKDAKCTVSVCGIQISGSKNITSNVPYKSAREVYNLIQKIPFLEFLIDHW